MAATGYTPISLYYSSTTGNTPTAGNLVAGELAINTADGKLFYKDSSGVVQIIASKTGVAAGSNTQVQYNSSGSFAGSANMTFDGTKLTLANDASISGLTVGKGGGAVASNTVAGNGALANGSNSGGLLSAFGQYALGVNTTGVHNDAYGAYSLYANTTGSYNDAYGVATLQSNTTGSSNVAIGKSALQSNTTASNNTAVGYQAGYSNTTGTYQAFFGYQSGNVTTGSSNAFFGGLSGASNTSGAQNTYIGYGAGYSMSTGTSNTIIGAYTGNNGGLDIRTANNYIVLSDGAGNPRGIFDGSGNFASGGSLSSWSGRTALQVVGGSIAYQSGVSNGNSTIFANNFCRISSADSAIAAGYVQGMVMNNDGSGQILMLTTSSTASAGGTISFTAGPYLARGGTSWTNSSDERLKNITGEITNGLDKVCSLRAAEFTWKSDESAKPCVGLIAQDVEKVLPEVISSTKKYNSEDETEYLGVSYTDTIPLLVAAIKELNAKVNALEAQLGAK